MFLGYVPQIAFLNPNIKNTMWMKHISWSWFNYKLSAHFVCKNIYSYEYLTCKKIRMTSKTIQKLGEKRQNWKKKYIYIYTLLELQDNLVHVSNKALPQFPFICCFFLSVCDSPYLFSIHHFICSWVSLFSFYLHLLLVTLFSVSGEFHSFDVFRPSKSLCRCQLVLRLIFSPAYCRLFFLQIFF